MMQRSPTSSLPLSRRRALGLLGGGVAGVALAGACSRPDDTSGSGDTSAINIPDSGAKLPTGNVTLRWTDASEFTKAVMPTFLAAYQKKHPNITANYDNLPQQELIRVLQLAIQSGDVPDVFRALDQVIAPGQAVAQGLIQPLDDVVPSFDKWKAAFPAGTFIEGLNVFDGKTYTFPMLGYYTYMVTYNQTYLEQAGIDLASDKLTFDTFRSTAKKLTEQGKGRYFGLVLDGAQPGRWSIVMLLLAQLAHADGGDFNYKTGTYNYTSDGIAAAIDLLMALKSDKSIDPSTASLNTDKAGAKLPAGQAAMMLHETGIFSAWTKQFPDFKFGFAELPVPSLTDHGHVGSDPRTSWWWASTKSQNLPIVGDIFSYLGSVEGQKMWQQVGGASLPVIHSQANDVSSLDTRLRDASSYFEQIVRILPAPGARNPDVGKVLKEQKPVTPDFGTLLQGIFTGQVDDPAKAMADLQSRSEKELDRAIMVARSKGAKVSREDWVFSDWDPSKNYVNGS